MNNEITQIMLDSLRPYWNLINDFLIGLRQHKLQPLCVMVYGSVARGDIVPGYSDLDILYIPGKIKVMMNERISLFNIVSSLNKIYGIKFHLRIRNLEDLYTQESGILDCGFTSSINKLRDGICIWGKPIDHYYYESIKTYNEDLILLNIKQRFSKLKYDIRALTSLPTLFTNHQSGYRLYTIINHLAELLLYSKGHYFLNKRNALEKSYHITSNSIFKNTEEIINSTDNSFFFFESLYQCEELIDKAKTSIKKSWLRKLKNVIVEKEEHKDYENLIYIDNKYSYFINSYKYAKTPYIENDNLVVKIIQII